MADCEWVVTNDLGDRICINGDSEHCTEYVGGEFSPCEVCEWILGCEAGDRFLAAEEQEKK